MPWRALVLVVGGLLLLPSAEAEAGPEVPLMALSIDADIANGSAACDPVDDVASPGNQPTVAICLSGNSIAPVEAFLIAVAYDSTIYTGVEVTDDPRPFLDDNPDINQAELGGGWDCSAFGSSEPVADSPEPGGLALALCYTLSGQTMSNGLLATIRFNAVGRGDHPLRFDVRPGPEPESSGLNVAGETYYCGVRLACLGATIKAEGETHAPDISSSPSLTPAPDATEAGEESTASPSPYIASDVDPNAITPALGITAPDTGLGQGKDRVGLATIALSAAVGGAALVSACGLRNLRR